ncbi:N-acetylmuramoyl-L-alanine amidase [Clostridium tertium]|uniref:N-acetylmuramoyl-L-alanine amidase n=1 Tax=Clostridium tertium TaxID=1559 RepID=UPI001FD7BDE9|nr:N-acetylmuramoyl-L-alanine amidase [Clostridium tertium]MBP1869028.1 N-acetylmuramoyl-L-alanine amidase CwlA [Clostridium tertium]
MSLIQKLISQDKYSLKCPYSMTPKGICIHNTANDAPASNEISYMQNNNDSTSFHIAIDDNEAIVGIPFNRNTWHAGDGSTGDGNRNYISVEICYSKSGGLKFINAEKRAAKEVAELLKQYGWGISNVKKHRDFSNKYCPHLTLDLGWQRFLNMIQAELNTSTANNNVNNEEMYRIRKSWGDPASQIGAFRILESAKKFCQNGYGVFDSKGNKVYPIEKVEATNSSRYAENGTYYFNTAVTVRTAPEENTKTDVVYYAGESVIYHHVILNKDGFNWIEYARNNGSTGYLKVKDLSTGESYGYAK